MSRYKSAQSFSVLGTKLIGKKKEHKAGAYFQDVCKIIKSIKELHSLLNCLENKLLATSKGRKSWSNWKSNRSSNASQTFYCNRTFASRASGRSSSQKLVTARLMYLIRVCGTAHLQGARETLMRERWVVSGDWMLFKAVGGVDTENRILTYYDEPASGQGLVVAPSGRSSLALAIGSLWTLARSRPDDSRTRCDYWYRPPCRCLNPGCRTLRIPIWRTLTCDVLAHGPSCIGPCRTATCLN